MRISTQEDGFEYQAEQIFKYMKGDYETDQESNKECEEDVKTFAEWLWDNREELGTRFYEALDQWVGIDEFTEDLNVD